MREGQANQLVETLTICLWAPEALVLVGSRGPIQSNLSVNWQGMLLREVASALALCANAACSKKWQSLRWIKSRNKESRLNIRQCPSIQPRKQPTWETGTYRPIWCSRTRTSLWCTGPTLWPILRNYYHRQMEVISEAKSHRRKTGLPLQ